MNEIAQQHGLEIEWWRGLKLAATRDEVGKEDWSWRGMKLATTIEVEGVSEAMSSRVEGWRWRLGHGVIKQ
jgi:hypothetical protein